MFLVLLLSAVSAMALPSSRSEEDDRVIDLQELLRNVSDSYRDFGQGIKDLGSDIASNVKLVVDNVNANDNANVKLLIANDNANAEKLYDVLKKILVVLEKKVTTPPPEITTTTVAAPSTSPTPVQGRDCADLHKISELVSRSYVITVPSIQKSFKVFCDMKTDGGGWTVFQRRGDFGNPEDYFAKTWIEYKNGFGELEKEFWLGNDRISALTQQREYVLRVDLWDLEGNNVYAKYNVFKVENEQDLYRLSIDGFSGTAGDAMLAPNIPSSNLQGMAFSTKDRDNGKINGTNCSMNYGGGGGWWYNACRHSNLNGLNVKGRNEMKGIVWHNWKSSWYSMAFAEMKIRPADF